MIRLISTLVITLLIFVSNSFAQKLTGDWYGALDMQGQKLKINFHVSEKEGVYITTMDSPQQGAFGIPTSSTIITKNTLEVNLKQMQISFIGELKDEIIDGNFNQGGMSLPLILSKNKIITKKPKAKPQEPTKPYSYKSEDIYFINKKANNIKLAGTLTLPNDIKNPAVAILISGSGPNDRNEEILGHKPFLVLSDYLTRNGIAVLRYDDRGVAESQGSQENATSADFATDVASAIAYLKTRTDINSKKIGLIGHSEGGFIAPMVASKNKDLAFIVLLAGSGVKGDIVLTTQLKKLSELNGLSQENILFQDKMVKKTYDIIKNEKDIKLLRKELKKHLINSREKAPEAIKLSLTDDVINMQITVLTSPWMRYFITTDPKQFLEKTNCPVLAINGGKDFQVLPKLNLNAIKDALKHNKNVTTKVLKDLNHLFQKSETGALNEYAKNEETFNENAMKIITDWINKRF